MSWEAWSSILIVTLFPFLSRRSRWALGSRASRNTRQSGVPSSSATETWPRRTPFPTIAFVTLHSCSRKSWRTTGSWVSWWATRSRGARRPRVPFLPRQPRSLASDDSSRLPRLPFQASRSWLSRFSTRAGPPRGALWAWGAGGPRSPGAARATWKPIHSREAPLALCIGPSRGPLGARGPRPAREAGGAGRPSLSWQALLSRLPLLALRTMHRARLWPCLSDHSCLAQGYSKITGCPVQARTIIHCKEALHRVHAWHQATQLLWVSSRQAQHHHLKSSRLRLADGAEYVASQGLIHEQNHHPWHVWAAPRSIRRQQVSVSCDHSCAQVVPTWVHVGDVTDLLQNDAKVMGAIQREQRGGPVAVGQQANLDRLWPKRPQCRHQALQDPPRGPRSVSIIASGVQQEYHVRQAAGTPWVLCDRGLRTPRTIPDRCQREDIGDARL